MRQPPYLTKGNKIGIVATARKIAKEELQPAIDVFNSWGLEVVLGKNLFESDHQFSGTDEQRAQDLQQLLDDVSVKAIIVARGGYGSIRIIDQIDFTTYQQMPKWVIGYSDITVLHCHIHQLSGIPTLHATMPINFPNQQNGGGALITLKEILFGEKINYTFDEHYLNKKGIAKGILIGGNLSVMYSMLGSVSFPDTDGKILFIEDLDEYLYHIDRMMMGLKRAGMLSNLAGLVVGGMSDMRDNTIPFGKTPEEIIIEAVAEYNYPVCFGFPAGHITDNRAMKLGANHTLSVAKGNCSLNEIYEA
ncbi:MAG: LD-carboxypeptidase [Bacteroidia bacterium]|nr:LD-carboxypeptidase [Bacteroidia bacterium]